MTRAALIIALTMGLGACVTKGEVPPVITPPLPPPLPAPTQVEEPTPEADAEEAASIYGAYDESFTITDFWSGEWPDGFTVTSDDVVLMGRLEPHPSFPQEIACPIEKNTNVNPWNHDRRDADSWEFMTANQRTKITITEDVTLETGFSEEPKTLSLKAGDVLMYETYYAEGFFQASFEGEYYEINEADLNLSAEFEQGGQTDEWVNVECAFGKGDRAWLLLSEVQGQPGIGLVSFDEFGAASDLDKGPNNITM